MWHLNLCKLENTWMYALCVILTLNYIYVWMEQVFINVTIWKNKFVHCCYSKYWKHWHWACNDNYPTFYTFMVATISLPRHIHENGSFLMDSKESKLSVVAYFKKLIEFFNLNALGLECLDFKEQEIFNSNNNKKTSWLNVDVSKNFQIKKNGPSLSFLKKVHSMLVMPHLPTIFSWI